MKPLMGIVLKKAHDLFSCAPEVATLFGHLVLNARQMETALPRLGKFLQA